MGNERILSRPVAVQPHVPTLIQVASKYTSIRSRAGTRLLDVVTDECRA